jgi:Fe-S-cluster containining protein
MNLKPEKICRRCGKCCLANFTAYAAPEDLDRWRREQRRDILAMIEREHAVWMGNHLVSSDNGHYLRGCPFLTWDGDHSLCAIYDSRPRVCRDYRPGSSEICPQFALPRATSVYEK